ncbi:MAG TPA: XdhC/CoxI family protein [Symbiobacteriaceae bacterium]|nr:XdhC/CoxI family protein [Symbiobacteriaceae bacterium]
MTERRAGSVQVSVAGPTLGARYLSPIPIDVPGLIHDPERGEVWAEPLQPAPRLILLGAGHIASPLAAGAQLLGWSVVVIDDRPALLTPERFPGAQLQTGEWAEALAAVDPGPTDLVFLATRAHGHDLACLRWLYRAIAEGARGAALQVVGYAWLGMIGSHRRVAQIRTQLMAEGVDADWLTQLRTPVGLDIGAETPAEIAIAVLAELVLARRGGSGAPLSTNGGPRIHPGRRFEETDWAALIEMVTAGGPSGGQSPAELNSHGPRRLPTVALATVVRSWGHSPRAPGAKMLVWRDGRTWGSIGGGCGEAEVRRAALDALDEGRPQLYEVDLLDHPEELEGAICGGRYLVLIEPLEVTR